MPENTQESDPSAIEASGEPRQSKIAPVGRAPGGKPTESIENLLAGLGSRAASRALSKTGALAKLPAPQQLALREALMAASDSHKEAETTQAELAKILKKLHQAERELSEASLASSKRSADAAEQAHELRHDLAAAQAENDGVQARLRKRRIYLWLGALGLALASGIAVALAGAFLLPPMRPPPAAEPIRVAAEYSSGTPEPAARLAIPAPRLPERRTRGLTAEARALDRLDQDLAGLPLHEVAEALSAANQWLTSSGAPPCTVLSIEGDTSLLVTDQIKIKGRPDMPLAGSIERCAEALEHVIK